MKIISSHYSEFLTPEITIFEFPTPLHLDLSVTLKLGYNNVTGKHLYCTYTFDNLQLS